MNELTALKERVVFLLGKALSGDCEVLSAFPGEKPLSLSRPALAIALDSASLEPAALGGLGAGLSRENPGVVTISLRLDFFEPGPAAKALHSLYESACAALLEEAASLGLAGISCEPVSWDDSIRAWRLLARATVRGALTGTVAPFSPPEQGEITHFDLQHRRESDVS